MSRKTSWSLGVLLTLGLIATVWLNWPRTAFTFTTLSSADIAGVTGTAEDNYRLRVHLTGVRYTTTLKPWTELAEPARSLWAVLSFEDVAANGGKLSMYRTQRLQDPTLPSLAEVAASYQNLGAKHLAAWLVEADRSKGAAYESVPAALLTEGHAAWLVSTRQQAEEIARRLP